MFTDKILQWEILFTDKFYSENSCLQVIKVSSSSSGEGERDHAATYDSEKENGNSKDVKETSRAGMSF